VKPKKFPDSLTYAKVRFKRYFDSFIFVKIRLIQFAGTSFFGKKASHDSREGHFSKCEALTIRGNLVFTNMRLTRFAAAFIL
jgi:hypothetical protein